MMKRDSTNLIVLFCLVAFVSPSYGGSVTLFDEVNAATAGNDGIGRFGPLSASFSTGTSPGSLTDVIAKLTVVHDSIAALGNHRAGGDSIPDRPAASSGAG